MTNLNCSVNSCTHNNNDYCCINCIEVGGNHADEPEHTCCNSFEEKSGEFINSTESPNPTLDIKCTAKTCMYNNECYCEAEHVDIAGMDAIQDQETLCATFCCE